ncbi:leucine-tRNA ligase [Catenaria anguillulae PL171]|uniref:leucine--tRNA ligase n=1 Tax=Catenaria anguillulae PL171 TaxID=765915 RepID=A0A1Y2HRF8_9FUNG|nr:leucine-tRNA ligase [Catenaria anguillulae PL171]
MTTVEPKSTAKRDALQAAEAAIQKQWQADKVFEVDAPLDRSKPKYFSTFPYPYMNGRLHLGHFFSFSKVEFASGYQRLKGKQVLLPFGFHVTGMPIKACADKLKREVELFGKNFENYEAVSAKLAAEEEAKRLAESTAALSVSTPDGSPSKPIKKHSKAAAKAGPQKYQFQIMASMGVPLAEIHKFADSLHWLQYFPPLAMQDLNGMGCKIDWRRSFITTDVNPYYDSFVRWQFNKLHKLSKVKFGERHTIWSVKDGQACMDHDRASGEGVGPQEYVGIKLQVVREKVENPVFAQVLDSPALKNKQVYLVAATLRPETMYGQTNCFVGKDLEYGVWEISDSEAFVCTERAARNMSFQGFAKAKGVPVRLATVGGDDLIGTAVKAPLSKYDHVYVLPLDHVVANKGTGVVTSVPSDSPDDYAMTKDLKKKPEFYGIKPEWIQGYDPIPIIQTPTYGDMSAATACDMLKISSPKDRVQLDKAKEMVYKEGFYQGTMLIGDFKGQSVTDAKPKIREAMVAAGLAMVYSEPEKDVISRSGDECVVNLCDQWYLDYGEPEWMAQTSRVVDGLNTYHGETRNAFKQTLDWLNKWACARSFGLGTRLPWDPQFLIESLSDSTIYMAYYTVAHLLHTDLEGKHVGALNIKPDQMRDAEWEYLFNESAAYPSDSAVPKASLDKMRAEFTYFYPLDLRVSGKDLIGNHLTFFLYNHACLFPEHHWPKAIRVNGHLLFNSEKMSKSTGTFVTIADAIERYGADATRLAIADAGDSVEDANFVELTANAAILRLFTQREWSAEMMASGIKTLRTGAFSFADRVFRSRVCTLVRAADTHYEHMNYREALKCAFFEFQDARDTYRETTALTGEGMHADLVREFIELQAVIMAPLIPHWSEFIWRQVLGKPESIMRASWPVLAYDPEPSVLAASAYLSDVIYAIRASEAGLMKKRKGPAVTSKTATILIATTYPAWQEELLVVIRQVYKETGNDWKGKDLAALKAAGLLKNKKAMPFVNEIKKQLAVVGEEAFNRTLAFDEEQVVRENLMVIQKSVGFDSVVVKLTTDQGLTDEEVKKAELALPGNPALKLDLQ